MDDYLFRHKGATLFVVQLYLNSFLCLTSKLSGDIMLAFCHIYYHDGICISKQISLMAQHTNTYKLGLVGDSFIKFESNTSSDRLGKENWDTSILKMQSINANKLHKGTDETAKSVVFMNWWYSCAHVNEI